MEFKLNKSLTGDQVIILLWVVIVPIAILTMLIGKFMTCVLLGAGVYAYVMKTLGKVDSANKPNNNSAKRPNNNNVRK